MTRAPLRLIICEVIPTRLAQAKNLRSQAKTSLRGGNEARATFLTLQAERLERDDSESESLPRRPRR